MSRLQIHYKEKLTPQLMAKLELNNIMEVPKITKVTLNMGILAYQGTNCFGPAPFFTEHVCLSCAIQGADPA